MKKQENEVRKMNATGQLAKANTIGYLAWTMDNVIQTKNMIAQSAERSN